MSFVTDAFALKAKSIIKNLEKRNMEGFYCENSQALLDTILPMIENNSSIAWGGSQTLNECGLMDALQQSGSYTMIDRTTAKSPEEARQIFAKSVLADYYLMSTNAITLDGELINIDGNGNRVACLIQGPKQVFIIAGMNKVVTDIGTGLSRVQNIATPPNTLRLNKKNALHHYRQLRKLSFTGLYLQPDRYHQKKRSCRSHQGLFSWRKFRILNRIYIQSGQIRCPLEKCHAK